MLLISDLDGTAIDSEELIMASYEHVIETHNLQRRTRDELKLCIGTALQDLYGAWAPKSEWDKLYETHCAFQARNKKLVKPIPGIIDAFRALRDRGVKIAINTNRLDNTLDFLTLTGVSSFVDKIVTRYDVVNPKPHPEGINQIMHHFGAKTDETWMLGDTSIDVLAGKNAGIKTIAARFTSNEVCFNDCFPDYEVRNSMQLVEIICH